MISLASILPGWTRITTESLRDALMQSTSRLAMNSSTVQCSRSLTSSAAASLRPAAAPSPRSSMSTSTMRCGDCGSSPKNASRRAISSS